MERKQEQEYSDPFELLKNMQDVMLAYEPIEKKRASMGANSAKQSNAIVSGFYNSKLCTKNATN